MVLKVFLKTFKCFKLSPLIWIFELSQLVQILAKTKQTWSLDFTVYWFYLRSVISRSWHNLFISVSFLWRPNKAGFKGRCTFLYMIAAIKAGRGGVYLVLKRNLCYSSANEQIGTSIVKWKKIMYRFNQRIKTYVCTERIFDSRLLMYNKIFLRKLL